MLVFINPGHAPNGNPDSGAVNETTGLRECDVAKNVADKIEYYLNAAGVATEQLQSDSLGEVSRSFFADSSYMLSFSVLCSCVCSRLISPSVSSWHKQDNTLMHQSPGHIQRRTPYNF